MSTFQRASSTTGGLEGNTVQVPFFVTIGGLPGGANLDGPLDQTCPGSPSPPSVSLTLVSGSPPAQVRGELLRERVQQLEAQEGCFAESVVSLQLQKAARLAKTLWAYAALLSVQDVLLEELSVSETLTKAACAQILESHSPVSDGLGPGRGRGSDCRSPSAASWCPWLVPVPNVLQARGVASARPPTSLPLKSRPVSCDILNTPAAGSIFHFQPRARGMQ